MSELGAVARFLHVVRRDRDLGGRREDLDGRARLDERRQGSLGFSGIPLPQESPRQEDRETRIAGSPLQARARERRGARVLAADQGEKDVLVDMESGKVLGTE